MTKKKDLNHFLKVLDQIDKEGDLWDEEYKTPGPTKEVLFFVKSLLIRLNSEKILPTMVSQTVEEGMYLKFTKNGKEMHFEAYNDNDCGYLIVESNKIKENKDFKASLGVAVMYVKEFFIT